MEKGIQYMRELTVLEVIYNDQNDKQILMPHVAYYHRMPSPCTAKRARNKEWMKRLASFWNAKEGSLPPYSLGFHQLKFYSPPGVMDLSCSRKTWEVYTTGKRVVLPT